MSAQRDAVQSTSAQFSPASLGSAQPSQPYFASGRAAPFRLSPGWRIVGLLGPTYGSREDTLMASGSLWGLSSGNLGALSGPHWTLLGPSWGSLGPLLEAIEQKRRQFLFRSLFGARHIVFWGPLGTLWGRSWTLLGPSWLSYRSLLGSPWTTLEPPCRIKSQ